MVLRTLGGLELEGVVFPRPKLLLLLCYLALEGAQDRRHLAELFWPEATDALNRLSVSLSRLRRDVPGVIEADESRVWTKLQTDVSKLLAALRAGDAEQSLSLDQGPFLRGVYLKGWSAELEEWVYATREFVAERQREGLIGLAEAEAARGEFETAAERAEAACGLAGAAELEPEVMQRLYLLLVAGESPGAYQLKKAAETYGVVLSASRQQARERLFVGRLGASRDAPPALPPSNLPARATSFIGRDVEIAEVCELLADPGVRLVTLTGVGGIGKTRLAEKVAGEQLKLGQFRDGIYLLQLASLTSADLLAPGLADVLGLTLAGAEAPLEQLTRHIGERELLLIFDNFEHLLSDASFVAELLAACPHLKVLATSRERLKLAGEQLYPLAGLPYPEAQEVPHDVALFDALKLFIQRARRGRPEFAPTSEELPCLLDICRLVDGAPLGLELAAAWVRVLPLADIAAEIRRDLDMLVSDNCDVSTGHRSLRAVFEHSWRFLSAKEREVLAKLSVFVGGFGREAAAAVAGATIPVLSSLVGKSLLRLLANGRYELHPLLRQYSREKLGESPAEWTRAQASHATFFFELLRAKEGELALPEASTVAAVGAELENLQAAWRWGAAGAAFRLEALQTTAMFLWWHYLAEGKYREALEFFSGAAQALGEVGAEGQALLGYVLCAQAYACHHLGRNDEAASLARRGLGLARPSGHAAALLVGLPVLGLLAEKQGDYREAKALHEEALALAKAEGAHGQVLDQLNYLANLEYALGNDDSAKARAAEALALSRERRHRFAEVYSLRCLGWIHLSAGELHRALTFLNEGLRLARVIGFQMYVPSFLILQGVVLREQGSYRKARALFQEALVMAQRSGYRTDEALALLHLGRLMTALLEYEDARARFRQGLRVAWSSCELPTVIQGLLAFAELQAREGAFGPAHALSSLVLRHPAATCRDRQHAERLLRTIGAKLSREARAEVQALGRLDDAVRQLLEPAVRLEI